MDCPVTQGEVIDAKYRVDRVIAAGGMGVVVEARHLELEQQVAIKFLHTTGGHADAAAARLRREARVAARIRSQHAARVFDVGMLGGSVPYMVMEYLEGNDLADELAVRTRLPVEEAVRYVLQAVEALAEAHAAEIVHRDLKPENIFLALRPDGTRTVKLLDFGISKWVTPSSLSDFALNQSVILGSPPYMSPEQLRAADSVDHRADVWSLGTILYEAVTGHPAFHGPSLPEICAAVFETPPRRLRELNPELPEEFDRAVLRCLAKDPDRRYSTVADLAQALAPFAPNASVYAERAQRVLSGVPLSGRPTPVPSESFTLFIDSELPEPPTLRAHALESEVPRGAATEPPAAATEPPATRRTARTRGLAVVLAALGGTVFGIAAWTVSSARGALSTEPARADGAAPLTAPTPAKEPPARAAEAAPDEHTSAAAARPASERTAAGSASAGAGKRVRPAKARPAGTPRRATPAAPELSRGENAPDVSDFGGRR